ncbi:MAG: hypothetical protein QM496_05630 [Verrucomicrobiota bacterium]
MLAQIFKSKYFQFDFPVAMIMPLSLSLKGEFGIGVILLAQIFFISPKFIEHEFSFIDSKYIEILKIKKIGFVFCWVYSGALIVMFVFLHKNIIFFLSIASVGIPMLFRFLSRKRVKIDDNQ